MEFLGLGWGVREVLLIESFVFNLCGDSVSHNELVTLDLLGNF